MALEANFDFITDFLPATAPAAGDSRTFGDEHLRGIKKAIQGSFPNFAGIAVTSTEANLNYTTVAVGTMVASKCLVADAGKAFDFDNGAMANVDINSGTIDGVALGTTNTGNTEASTDSSTKLATTKFVDDVLASRTVTSTARTTYAATNNWSWAHSQSSVPDTVQAYAICTTIDQGYAVGDKILLGQTAGTLGIQVWSSATEIGAVIGTAGIGIFHKTTGVSALMGTGDWGIYFEGIWLS